MAVRIGVDTGGTFTDFVRVDGAELRVYKVRSTPDDPARGIVEGVRALCPGCRRLDIVHGSTVATNAVLERKGARVALVATRGFEDVLLIGRQTRPELYNVFVGPRQPIVDRARTFGIDERLDAAGRVVAGLEPSEVESVARLVRECGADIVAVCLLHSYANPGHERAIARQLRASGMRVCVSSDVLPEYREFERWSTTAVNAYVTPVVERYLANLEAAGLGSVSVMQSNGGSISPQVARTQAVRTILSGPAAGVVGAKTVATAAGFRRTISFDMGGTSTDVALIDDGFSMTSESQVGDFPVRLPMIDIQTVGAGGGSIAAVDAGGALRVGPASAGADPGPACYGQGDRLTVTDANLLLGRLDPRYFFDGRMAIDVDRSRRAARELAGRLHVKVEELAEGVLRVANANMERAIRVVSVERGHDPRLFALLAFGGAGGMHACDLADRLDMQTVVAPRYAGVLSALGMLVADAARDYSQHALQRVDRTTAQTLRRRFAPMIREAREHLRRDGFGRARQQIVPLVDVRYEGQSYELTVPFGPDFRSRFDREHERRYGYADRERATEVVTLRVAARGLTAKPRLSFTRPKRSFQPRPMATRRARFDGAALPTAYYRWSDLDPGASANGPAVITSGEATVVVPPAFRFGVDGFGNVVMTKRRRSR